MLGKAANTQADAGMLAAFSDNKTTIDEIIIEGDAAALRWTWEGTHSGISPSLGIPPDRQTCHARGAGGRSSHQPFGLRKKVVVQAVRTSLR